MLLHCPICGEDCDSTDFRVEPGTGGGLRCPKCQELLSFSYPYGWRVAIASVLIAWAILVLLHVRTILGFAFGTVLIWIPLSLFLNTASARIRPITLR